MLRNAALLPRHYGKHASQLISRKSAQFSTSTEPNKPIELDPALQALLQDADKSLTHFKVKRSKRRSSKEINLERDTTSRKELEIVSRTVTKRDDVDETLLEAGEEDTVFPRSERKSPAASFGSRQIGTAILPYEMQQSVMALISGRVRDGHHLFHLFIFVFPPSLRVRKATYSCRCGSSVQPLKR